MLSFQILQIGRLATGSGTRYQEITSELEVKEPPVADRLHSGGSETQIDSRAAEPALVFIDMVLPQGIERFFLCWGQTLLRRCSRVSAYVFVALIAGRQ